MVICIRRGWIDSWYASTAKPWLRKAKFLTQLNHYDFKYHGVFLRIRLLRSISWPNSEALVLEVQQSRCTNGFGAEPRNKASRKKDTWTADPTLGLLKTGQKHPAAKAGLFWTFSTIRFYVVPQDCILQQSSQKPSDGVKAASWLFLAGTSFTARLVGGSTWMSCSKLKSFSCVMDGTPRGGDSGPRVFE